MNVKLSEVVALTRKESPKGYGCECGALAPIECGCSADWTNNDKWNECIEELDKFEIDHNALYTLIMNGFAMAREKGLTNLYIHGDSAEYVSKHLAQNAKLWIVRKG